MQHRAMQRLPIAPAKTTTTTLAAAAAVASSPSRCPPAT